MVRSGQESELLPVLLGEADEPLPLLGVGADGLAELGDDLLDSIRFKRPSARRQRERDLKHAQATERERETCECSAIAFPLSWLKRLRPMMLRATTTSGANRPLPAFTLPIIRAGDRSGRALDRGRDMATTE